MSLPTPRPDHYWMLDYSETGTYLQHKSFANAIADGCCGDVLYYWTNGRWARVGRLGLRKDRVPFSMAA